MTRSSVSGVTAGGRTRRAALRAGVGGLAYATGGAAALASCSPPGAPAQQARPQRREQITIDFNTWYDVVTAPIVPLFAKFEQEHNVKINYDINSSNRDMAKYTAWYVSGTAPDVVNGENFSWSQFYNGGNILEITDYLKRDKLDITKQYVLMGSEIWCGKNYAMPFDADPRAVYYNKTLLQQAGVPDPWDDLKGQWTFDDMLATMLKVTRVTGNSGTDIYGVHCGYTGMSESNGMFVWTFGGTWADFDKMRYTLDSRESLEAHNLVYDWFTNKKVVMPNSVVSELGGGEKPFTLGRAAFRIRAAASHGLISREIAGNFEYDIAPFPGRRKGQPGVTIVSGNPHTVSKTTKYPDESYEFIKFLAGPEVQGFWAQEKIQLPTLRKAQEEFVKDAKRHTQVFADAYKVPYGIHFRHNNLSRHYSEYGTEMGEVFGGQKNMSDTLKAFTQRVNNEVEYGSCLPYKGMVVPIKP
ncbi:MAG TPA: sugar ABC transporter substrate-binding protein [Chloroflexota bacterium]|jgi:multiple sugar transport system substrate-binding protein|nr:sugar ABC transporter substrate-binding protein [Chloroflexota bacterium]